MGSNGDMRVKGEFFKAFTRLAALAIFGLLAPPNPALITHTYVTAWNLLIPEGWEKQ